MEFELSTLRRQGTSGEQLNNHHITIIQRHVTLEDILFGIIIIALFGDGVPSIRDVIDVFGHIKF